MSLYPPCLAAGGSHYRIGADALAFAPLQHIDDASSEQTWAEEWVATLAELQGLTVLPGHRVAIRTAMDALRANPRRMRSLSDFFHVVQDAELRQALKHYTAAGALGHLLDASEDDLALSNFMVFEVEELMQLGDRNLIPVLTYLFHRIERALHGQPTLLLLDEAWIMLGHPVFREKLREWLKVMRKANCAVVLATQSLSDAARSGILDVLVESCPTKIFLPNATARQDGQRELYAGMGLNARQLDIIASATPKRDYYMTTPAGRRLIQLALGKKALAFAGASDKASLARIQELQERHGQNWVNLWMQERGV